MQEFAIIGGVQFVSNKLIFQKLERTVEVYNLVINLKKQFTRGRLIRSAGVLAEKGSA